jgi:hypothetical protein
LVEQFPSVRLVEWSKWSAGTSNKLNISDLVHVVVDVLASNSWSLRRCVLRGTFGSSVFELSSLGFNGTSDSTVITMTMLSVLYTSHPVVVLLWHNLLVNDRESRGMVMIL